MTHSNYNKYFIKRIVCPICLSKKTKQIFNKPFLGKEILNFIDDYYQNQIPHYVLEDTDYSIQKCLSCTGLFQEYIFNDDFMGELYENWISKEESIKKKIDFSTYNFSLYTSDLNKINLYMNKKPKDTTILEYGMGWGFWSRIAQSMNFDVSGFEVSKSRIDFAKKNNIKILSDINELKKKSFDFIYSFAVFEHISNPYETLKLLKNLLNKNGLIYIYVPNGIFMQNKFNKSWKASKDALHPLEHINCFNRKSLKVVANKLDLEIKYNIFSPRYKSLSSIITEPLKHLYNNTFSTGVFLKKKF